MKKKLGKSLAAMLTVTMLAGSLTACGGDTGDGQTSETPVSDEAQETSGNEEAADSSSGGEVTAEEIPSPVFSVMTRWITIREMSTIPGGRTLLTWSGMSLH